MDALAASTRVLVSCVSSYRQGAATGVARGEAREEAVEAWACQHQPSGVPVREAAVLA